METTMAAGGTFSVRLPPETKRELEEYAKATKRSSAFIVFVAVEQNSGGGPVEILVLSSTQGP